MIERAILKQTLNVCCFTFRSPFWFNCSSIGNTIRQVTVAPNIIVPKKRTSSNFINTQKQTQKTKKHNNKFVKQYNHFLIHFIYYIMTRVAQLLPSNSLLLECNSRLDSCCRIITTSEYKTRKKNTRVQGHYRDFEWWLYICIFAIARHFFLLGVQMKKTGPLGRSVRLRSKKANFLYANIAFYDWQSYWKFSYDYCQYPERNCKFVSL